jgi:hemoglobin
MTSLGTSSSFDASNTPYEALGGDESVRGLVDTFYDRMDAAPQYAGIRSLHPADLATSREKLYLFLSGWLGGPGLYVERYGHPRLRGRHMPFAIGEPERDQWLACMGEALDDAGVTGELRVFLNGRFAHVADFMRNQSPPGSPAPSGP